MNFRFESLMDFLLMDGHGAFVWVSYLVTLVTITLLILIPHWQKRQLLIQLKRQQRIEEVTAVARS